MVWPHRVVAETQPARPWSGRAGCVVSLGVIPGVASGRRTRGYFTPSYAGYFRPLLIAFTSSPLAVSPLNSQKNAPPRLWLLAHAILVPTVAGVS